METSGKSIDRHQPLGDCSQSYRTENHHSDDKLLDLSKKYLSAQLSFNLGDIEQTKGDLKCFLETEFQAMKLRNKDPKKVMMMKIRCVLVKHPYDHVGRNMAKSTKVLFQREVLKEPGHFPTLKRVFRIPQCLKKRKFVQKLLVLFPISVAVMGTMQKGSLYCYDMWSDVNVVQELEKNVQNFKMPNFVEVDNIEQKITDFVLKKVQTSAVPAMKEPCELLDLIEDFADDAIPFYGNVVTKIAQVKVPYF